MIARGDATKMSYMKLEHKICLIHLHSRINSLRGDWIGASRDTIVRDYVVEGESHYHAGNVRVNRVRYRSVLRSEFNRAHGELRSTVIPTTCRPLINLMLETRGREISELIREFTGLIRSVIQCICEQRNALIIMSRKSASANVMIHLIRISHGSRIVWYHSVCRETDYSEDNRKSA